ncbi:MAG: hypothetical protein M0R17_02555 [Candidatus Omnitrophica bacterium]|jgi:hypothetical protein|nr:hypothetical protein [Candidatus Omnitrophota bacterium]
MRNNYPVLSQELNDKFMSNYEHLVYLLGQKIDGYNKYSGVYDVLELACSGYVISFSGIPSVYNDKFTDILKFDYIYRKHFKEI